jgi:1-acyl-sn-glycerol-3-phosphate acyltransferase
VPSSIEPQVLAGRPVQWRGSRLARAVLALIGWRLGFDGLPAPQGVAIVYPHTSNWDFPIGLLAKWGTGIPVTFWGKDTLFRIPLFGRWLRWLGGVPVDRSSARGIVGQMARDLSAAREAGRFMWLALAPEGTRSHAAGWRSGFYHVAVEAGVPLALVRLDWGARFVGIERYLRLCGDREADMRAIADGFAGVAGYRPALAAPIRLS